MQSRLYGIACIFILHAITMLVLCPSRRKPAQTAAVWGAVILVCVGGSFMLMRMFPDFGGAVTAFSLAVVLFTVTTFYLAQSMIAQTVFLLLAYMQAFMVAVFLSGYFSQLCFAANLNVAILIRSALQICIIFACAVLHKRLEVLGREIVKGWWPLNFLSALLLSYLSILTLHLYSTGFANHAQCRSVFLLMIVLVAVYGVFFHTIRQMQAAAAARQIELKNQFLLRQLEFAKDALETARRYRHDRRHHDLNIAALARNGETEAILRYLDENEEEIKQRLPLQLCENLAVDNILSAYGKQAEQNGIAVRFDVSIERELGVRDTDLVAILANLLENAVQGCARAQAPSPLIEVSLKRKANKLVIKVRNTAEKGICFENGLPKGHHGDGLGIGSVIAAAARYSGQTDFHCEDGIFVSRIILDLPAVRE